MQGDDARGDFRTQGVAAGQALFVHKAHKAARAVAAMLDFTAVRIEDAIAEVSVGMGWCLYDQHLISPDAEVSVSQGPGAFGRHRYGLAHAVEHDEIVAGAVHFREV